MRRIRVVFMILCVAVYAAFCVSSQCLSENGAESADGAVVCTSDEIVLDIFHGIKAARQKYCDRYVEVTGVVRDAAPAGTESSPGGFLRLECSANLDTGSGWELQTFRVWEESMAETAEEETERVSEAESAQEAAREPVQGPGEVSGQNPANKSAQESEQESEMDTGARRCAVRPEEFLTAEEFAEVVADLCPGDRVTVYAYVGPDGIDADYGLSGALIAVRPAED